MGVADTILSMSPNCYVPLQDAAGAALPEVRPASITPTKTGSPTAGQAGPNGDLSWSVNGAGGNYISLANDAATRWATAGSFSLLCAVNLSSVVSFATVIGKAPASGGTTHEYLLRLNGTSSWQFWLSQQGSGNGHATSQGGSAPTTGVWYWLLGTYDTTIDTISLYVNGVQVNSNNSWTGSESGGTSTGVRLGDYQGTGINGRIAHVGFWQSCLTAAQALAIYNASLRNKVAY